MPKVCISFSYVFCFRVFWGLFRRSDGPICALGRAFINRFSSSYMTYYFFGLFLPILNLLMTFRLVLRQISGNFNKPGLAGHVFGLATMMGGNNPTMGIKNIESHLIISICAYLCLHLAAHYHHC